MTGVDWGLAWRMVVSALLLVALTAVLFGVLYLLGAVAGFVVATSARGALVGGLVAGVGGLLYVGVLEYRHLLALRDWEDASVVSSEEFPHLHALTARVAAQLGVPTPTIALSTSEVPEAMVVGVRPSETRLVLSYGTLGALDDQELEAVIAHELAHVRNRDAAVTTVLALPAVLSEGIKTRCEHVLASLEEDVPESAARENAASGGAVTGDPATGDSATGGPATDDGGYTPPEELMPATSGDDEDEDDNDLIDWIVCHVLVAVSSVTLVCSRAVVALLARAREHRADRVAVRATGEPSDLASALRTLDDRIQAQPAQDLRAVTSASALSILPLDPAVIDAVGLDRSGDGTGAVVGDGDGAGAEANAGAAAREDRSASSVQRLFRTHPSTAERLRRLEAMEPEVEDGP